jgi:hypothetical protein
MPVPIHNLCSQVCCGPRKLICRAHLPRIRCTPTFSILATREQCHLTHGWDPISRKRTQDPQRQERGQRHLLLCCRQRYWKVCQEKCGSRSGVPPGYSRRRRGEAFKVIFKFKSTLSTLSLNFEFQLLLQISQAIGYSVELVCHVEAYPRPTITWVHQGIQLSSNQVALEL